jgi:hypothetical protein
VHDLTLPLSANIRSLSDRNMEEIKRAMLEDDDEDENYLDSLRQNSGSGLINTRISDRENEVIPAFTAANVISTASSFNLCYVYN